MKTSSENSSGTVTIRLNAEEKSFFSNFAEFKGVRLSTLFKQSLAAAIEDEIDMQLYAAAVEELQKAETAIPFEQVLESRKHALKSQTSHK